MAVKCGEFLFNEEYFGKPSSDGQVYLSGVAFRLIRTDPASPNWTQFRVPTNKRLLAVDLFQNDNDDPPASRTAWLMEYGNVVSPPKRTAKWVATK